MAPKSAPVLTMARENSPIWGIPNPTLRETRPLCPVRNVAMVSAMIFPNTNTAVTTNVGTM